jgi:hypothetical protein
MSILQKAKVQNLGPFNNGTNRIPLIFEAAALQIVRITKVTGGAA